MAQMRLERLHKEYFSCRNTEERLLLEERRERLPFVSAISKVGNMQLRVVPKLYAFP